MTAIAAPLVAGLGAFALGFAAVQPGVGFWDTAEFQVVGPVLGTAHPTGFPAYVLLGWLASVLLQPLGEPAFRMNLLSTILVATAASMTAVLVRLLTGRSWLGLAAGLVLASTPVVWALATRADPHAFGLAAVSVVLVLLVAWERGVESGRRPTARPRLVADRLLMGAGVAYGVALAGHSLAILMAPGIALFVLAVDPSIRRRPRVAARYAAAVVVAAAVLYLELPIRAWTGAPLVYDHPDTPIGFIGVAIGAQFSGTLGHPLANLGGKLAGFVDLAVTQLGLLAPIVPLGAVVAARRLPRYALLSLPTALLMTAFASSYTNADIGRYYAIPALLAITWVAILPAILVDAVQRALERLTPAPLRRLPLGVAAAALVIAPSVTAAPARYASVDQRANNAAGAWLDATLTALPPHAVVVSWWDYSTTLWYGQLIEGRRPDIWIVDDRTRLDQGLGDVQDVINAQLGQRPVFLIRMPDELHELADHFALRRVPTLPGYETLEQVVGVPGAGR